VHLSIPAPSGKLSFTLPAQTSISRQRVQLQGDTRKDSGFNAIYADFCPGVAVQETMVKIGLALCITELELGGAERCLTELAIRVDPQRFSPVVYCLAGRPKCEEASCVPALKAAGVEVHFLGGRHIWQFPAVVGRLKQLLGTQKPQIIQTFLFHANIVGRIAARRVAAKAVLAGIRVAERGKRWHLWIDRMTERWVTRYVCVSQSVADFSAGQGGLPPEKLVLIHNGIDLNKYPAAQPITPSALRIPAGRRLITFVGRLEPQKGVQWLIESAPQWLGSLPGCDLVLVGDGWLKGRLKAICERSGITERVHFVGWRPDIPEILAASDLLVLPSAWEGMPNIVLEAMASRRPVVASDVEGVRELFGPAEEEQIVPYADSQAFTDKLVRIINNRELAAEIGGRNRRRAEEHFAISRMVAAYERLWESLATG
jgi:glycosyltransferase involved in cell wall biosynthesis